MQQDVKKFIENNIEYIESNDWYSVFLSWYREAQHFWPSEDEYFNELLTVFKNSGIDVDFQVRHSILYDEIFKYMSNIKTKHFNDYHHVGQYTISNHITSALGYTDEQLYKIMDEAANNLNMEFSNYYGGGYIWR